MLKKFVCLAILISISLTLPVMAQNASNNPPSYAQQAQNLLNQASKRAEKQFDKSYPMPKAPALETGKNTKPSASLPALSSSSSDDSAEKQTDDNTPPIITAEPPPKIINPPPVYTTPKNRMPSQPSQNIFMPPSANNGTYNSANTAPNPYR